MNKRKLYKIIGLGIGVAGTIASFFIWQRFRAAGVIGVAAEKIVDDVINESVKKITTHTRRKKSIKKVTKQAKRHTALVVKKNSKASFLWRLMKPSRGYTQIELQELSHVPYRSVRRYVESLLSEKKIKASGYGKGRRFSKITGK